MNLLFIGDVNGRAGRNLVQEHLDRLVDRHRVDYVVANVENAAEGFGITPPLASELEAMGLHVMTSGNHIWDKAEILPYIEEHRNLLRPHNFPAGTPGTGVHVGATPGGVPVAVINLMGRVFMNTLDCPFRAADRILEELKDRCRVILVDFHAEATSEKVALGWYLDGRVTAVVGTHTHVQTADERLLPQGTAVITDVGMTGARDSVIGVEKDLAIRRFLQQMPVRFACARKNPRLCAVVVEVDEATGRARKIERLDLPGAE
ncbi:MAG: TIGR00282 family metallophosphoesterase [Acidobacteria bacterium]|nr:TIGR00282 family metallophosphoesterase [Acidobacteriota bacterium]